MKTYRLTPILLLLLAGCAQAPQRAESAAQPIQQREVAEQENAKMLPSLELDDELLYEFLLGEVAMQRGHLDLAAQTYLDLAQSTRDPRVARRAAQLTFEARDMERATTAFKLWLELEPGSPSAKQMLVTLLLTGGKVDEARPYLVELLAAEPDNAGTVFVRIYPLLARQADKEAVLKLLRELAKPYPNEAEVHWVLAQAAAAAGKYEEALAEVKQARTIRPNWEAAALLNAQLLQPIKPQQALELLHDFLSANPDAMEARLLYARMLLEQKRYQESRTEFQRVLDAHPENAELAFAVALLSLQLGELERAEKELQQTLMRGKRDQNAVYYYLGQLSEAKKDMPAAMQQYRKVQQGEYVYAARLRTIYLLGTTGKLNEARELLHATAVQDNQQRVQLILLEAQLLRDANQLDAAYEVLQQGLQKLPNHPDLLYETALLADKMGKHDISEQLIRKLIEIQPENANAYNVLGYSLLDRNVRVKEGMALVEKAYRLSPNDAAIIDSVGWGHYRLGNLDKSLEFLRQAFAANPDPEIASHLGEVLWVHGDRAEAKKIWSDSLKQNPQSEPLQAVMKKFIP